MIYVDFLIDYGWKLGPSCHMMSENINYLHAFAAKIGLKRDWLDVKGIFPHYDLVASKRIIAIKNGAIEILDRKQLVVLFKKLQEIYR